MIYLKLPLVELQYFDSSIQTNSSMPPRTRRRSPNDSTHNSSPTATISSHPAADARASTDRIEKTIVGDGSLDTYMSQIIRFAMFIFDTHQCYLTESYLAAMIEADEKDKSDRNKDRTALRNAIAHAIDAIKPQRSGQHHNSFLKIDGEGHLRYDIVLEYMQTKFNYVTVDRSCAESYMRALKLTDPITSDMHVDNDMVRLKVFQSYEQYSGIRSAILWIYKLARVKAPFQSDLSSYLKGVLRHIAAAKQHLGLKLTKGKAAMKPEAFKMIAQYLFESSDKRDIFCHLMFLLDWNLMKRAENCVHAKMIHIEFENDCLKFTFEKEKGRQHGDIHGPWHCFANPENPHICIMLAFARYIFTIIQRFCKTANHSFLVRVNIQDTAAACLLSTGILRMICSAWESTGETLGLIRPEKELGVWLQMRRQLGRQLLHYVLGLAGPWVESRTSIYSARTQAI